MSETQSLRERVQNDVPADAVTVEEDDDRTTIRLFYHEPEPERTKRQTPFGIAVVVESPDPVEQMAQVMEDVQTHSSPDDWSVVDKDGFYVVRLTYEDGNSW